VGHIIRVETEYGDVRFCSSRGLKTEVGLLDYAKLSGWKTRSTRNIDDGFVVLVHVAVGSGLPYQGTYLVGCSTHEEAEAKIKELYPSEPNLRLYVSSLRVDDTKDLKLARNEVREWR
jgi:hypothetical protein